MLGGRANGFQAWTAPKEVHLHMLAHAHSAWVKQAGVLTVQTTEGFGTQRTMSGSSEQKGAINWAQGSRTLMSPPRQHPWVLTLFMTVHNIPT